MDRPKHPLRAGIVHSIRAGLPNKKASQSVRKNRVFDKPFVKKSALIGTERSGSVQMSQVWNLLARQPSDNFPLLANSSNQLKIILQQFLCHLKMRR